VAVLPRELAHLGRVVEPHPGARVLVRRGEVAAPEGVDAEQLVPGHRGDRIVAAPRELVEARQERRDPLAVTAREVQAREAAEHLERGVLAELLAELAGPCEGAFDLLGGVPLGRDERGAERREELDLLPRLRRRRRERRE